MDHVYHLSISEEAEQFLAGLPDKGKVVMLSTADSTEGPVGPPDVDAVTAASRMDLLDQTVQDVLGRIKQRLGEP